MSNLKIQKMKKLFFLLLVATLFVGCSKKDALTVNGIVQGFVKDMTTSQFLQGVVIDYNIGKDTFSVTSNSEGHFYINGLPAGYTSLYFNKTGYSTRSYQAWIEPITATTMEKDAGTVNYYEDIEAFLPAQNAGIKGTVMKYIGANNEIRPAASFTVLYDVGNEYIPSMYSAITDATGAYSFTNLPSGVYGTLMIKPTSDDYNYYDYNLGVYLVPNSTSEFNITLDNTEKQLQLISTNLDTANGTFVYAFPINSNIVLVFNKDVSKLLTERDGSINLSTFGSLNLDDNVAFNGATVTINPPLSLNHDQQYELQFRIYSTIPGDYYNGDILFRTTP